MHNMVAGHTLHIDPDILAKLASERHSDESIALYLVDGLELGHIDALRNGHHDEWCAWIAETFPHSRPHVVCWHLARFMSESASSPVASAVGRHAVAFGRVKMLVTRETDDEFWGHLTKAAIMGNRFHKEGAGPFRFAKEYVELV